MYLSPRNSRNRGLLRSDTCWVLTQCRSWPVAMLAKSNLIYAVICYMRGDREGAVGAVCPQLWGHVNGAPKPSARTEKLLRFIFSFRFYRWKGQRMKNKWHKTNQKTRFGSTLDFSLSWTTLAKSVEPPPPQPANSSCVTGRDASAFGWDLIF